MAYCFLGKNVIFEKKYYLCNKLSDVVDNDNSAALLLVRMNVRMILRKRICFMLLLAALLSVSRTGLYAAPPPADSARWEGMSIRTNLLWNAAAEPNIGLEFPVGDHWSVGANAGIKAWPGWLAWDWDNSKPAHWRNFAVVPEVRYYLDQVYKGFFAGADFIYTHFNVGAVKFPFNMYPETVDNRVQGSYWAGGLFAGYAWWPFQHWRIELEAGVAAGLAAYDRFDCDQCGSKTGEIRKTAVVPKLGLNVAFNPVRRKEAQRRRAARWPAPSGTDTLTVFSAPVAFVVNLKEVEGPESAGDRLAKEKPWVIPIEKYRPLDYLTRPGKDSIQYVVFPVGSAGVDRQLGRNAEVLDQLQSAIETIRNDETTDEILVSIVGLASIEGPRMQNDTLSVHRARAVADYLNGRTFLNRKFFETIGKGEAWDWFKDQLEAIPDGGKGLTAEEVSLLREWIYHVSDADERERQLRARPALYKKVVNTLLKDQRNAGYIRVYYSDKPDPATQKLNGPVYALIGAKKYHHAVKEIQADKAVMELVHSNPEAANAYGVALYFTALDNKDAAAELQAVSLLQKAAREGSEAAAQNLKGIETYGPARKEYEAWKELIND